MPKRCRTQRNTMCAECPWDTSAPVGHFPPDLVPRGWLMLMQEAGLDSSDIRDLLEDEGKSEEEVEQLFDLIDEFAASLRAQVEDED